MLILTKKYTLNLFSDERIPFPSLSDPATLTLSVIIPAYNEEERLPLMLEDCCDYLTIRYCTHHIKAILPLSMMSS